MTEIREDVRRRIDDGILAIYENHISKLFPMFPVNPIILCLRSSNCRAISYQKLAHMHGTTVTDIIRIFGSHDGCTHYDRRRNRFLITFNADSWPDGRIRWTLAHELGHVVSGHFYEIEDDVNSGSFRTLMPEMEAEADYFAASLLAPLPAISRMKASSAEDVRKAFGLSNAAANNRWREYRSSSEEHVLDDLFRRKFPSYRGQFL